jgi:hypothetical protein
VQVPAKRAFTPSISAMTKTANEFGDPRTGRRIRAASPRYRHVVNEEALAHTEQSRDVVLPCDARPGKDGDPDACRVQSRSGRLQPVTSWGRHPVTRAWLKSGLIRSAGKGVRRHRTHGISRAEGDQTRVSRLRCLAKGAADTHASPLILGPSMLAAIKEAMLDANPGADAVSPSLGMSAPRRSALGRNHD